jgi:hypothetical protein
MRLCFEVTRNLPFKVNSEMEMEVSVRNRFYLLSPSNPLLRFVGPAKDLIFVTPSAKGSKGIQNADRSHSVSIQATARKVPIALTTESSCEDLGRKLAEQPALITLGQLLEHGVHRFPSCIPYSTQSVARNSASNGPSKVGDDEAHGPTAQPTNQRPKLARGPGLTPLRKPLFSEHLLKYTAKLFVAEFLLFSVACLATTKAKGAPWKATCICVRRRAWDLFICIAGSAAAAKVVGSCSVVVAAASGV